MRAVMEADEEALLNILKDQIQVMEQLLTHYAAFVAAVERQKQIPDSHLQAVELQTKLPELHRATQKMLQQVNAILQRK